MERVNADKIEFGDDYIYRHRGEPFSGIGFELDGAERLISEIEFSDGMRNGNSREWSQGNLVLEHGYRNNTRHGVQREWSESGTLISEEHFEHGICVRRTSWTEDGTLCGTFELDQSDPQFKLLESIRSAVN